MKKIIIIILLLFITLNTASAVDLNNLNMPETWENTDDGIYTTLDGQNMMIQEWKDNLKTEYYTNYTDEGYTVMEDGNHTYLYIDSDNQMAGCFEVVNIGGEEYFVNFWTSDYLNDESVANTTWSMVEFNSLNNLTPVDR